MKILHVIPSISPVRGGPSQAIIEMVRALRSQGVEAEIATTNDNGPGLLNVKLQSRSIYKDIPTWFFPKFSSEVPAIQEFTFSKTFTTWLWQNIQYYDLLHVHALVSYPSTMAMTIASIKGVPYIVRPGGHLCKWSLRQAKIKKNIYLNLIGFRNINSSKLIQFMTSEEQEEAIDLGLTSSSMVLSHGLNVPEEIPFARDNLRELFKVKDDEHIILFMSRLHPKKGLELLIDAASQLQRFNFRLVIAGSGEPDYESSIKNRIIDRGLGGRCEMVGFASGKLKDTLLQGSDLFVLTSYSENFGVAVLEALASGLPVLTTPDVALQGLVLEKDLGYVANVDIESIKNSLLCFLENPVLAKAKGLRARAVIVEEYSWDKIAWKLIESYKYILKSSDMALT